MHRFTLPITIVFLGILVAILHSVALDRFLYFHLPWLDVVMHFLGGLLVSLFGLWAFMKHHADFESIPKSLLLFDVVLFVFIIGMLWETFELRFGLISDDLYVYTIDTFADFFMNMVGAMVGFFLVESGHIFNDNKKIDE